MASLTTASSADDVIAWLQRAGRQATIDAMARYAIPSDNALGVTVGELKAASKQLGRRHELAEALWESGWYEARMLAAMVGEPERLTPAAMDRWCCTFDNWAICDTVCFHLFDRTPHAWGRLAPWARRKPENERRAAFALLWGLTVHDKKAPDAAFIDGLALIEKTATDERNFVKKGVNMALRATGKRNAALHAAACEVAARLAASADATARWIGKDALRELSSKRPRA